MKISKSILLLTLTLALSQTLAHPHPPEDSNDDRKRAPKRRKQMRAVCLDLGEDFGLQTLEVSREVVQVRRRHAGYEGLI